MFFSVRDINSSAIEECAVNLRDNQVLVKYNNSPKSYIYNNVDSGELIDFLAGEYSSVGKFVNAWCKDNFGPVTVIA